MPAPKDPEKARIWRERITKALLDNPPDNSGMNNPFYGKHHTAETKERISQTTSGKNNGLYGTHRPQYVKDAVSKAHKGKPPAIKGKHLSEEAKRLISEKNRGKKSRLGKRLTDAQRLNISNGTKLHAIKGKDNPRWKGGISPANQRARYSFEMKEWRRKVFERDHFICQQCGYDKGKILIAHHVKPFSQFPELRLDIDNGITLCRNCHNLIP